MSAGIQPLGERFELMPTPAGPETNQFRCNACGRWFNTQAEVSEHEVECRRAKMSTETGRRELEHEDHTEHQRNDHDSTEQPFQHGTRTHG
jgi:hypothetical protein